MMTKDSGDPDMCFRQLISDKKVIPIRFLFSWMVPGHTQAMGIVTWVVLWLSLVSR